MLGSSYIWYTLSNVAPPNNLLLNSYFKKTTVRLHILYVFNMLRKFQNGQRLIVMSSINYLNSSFCNLK